MRKIPCQLESPIDNWTLQIIERSNIMDPLYKLGFTPNMITTVGNIFRILSIYFLNRSNKVAFFILAVLGFFADCLDGHFARTYNMTSKFGDYYDHISDLLYHFILMRHLWMSPKFQGLSLSSKILLILGITGFSIMFLIHMGCQEKNFNVDTDHDCHSPTLAPFKALCLDKSWLNWTRYFGTGTYVLLIYILAVIF